MNAMIPINFGLGQANVEVETEEDGRQQMYKKGGKLSVNRPDFGPPTYGLSSMGTRLVIYDSQTHPGKRYEFAISKTLEPDISYYQCIGCRRVQKVMGLKKGIPLICSSFFTTKKQVLKLENNVILVRNERLTVDPDSPRNPHICDPVDIDESESVQSDRHARANAGFFLPRRKRTKQNNDLSNSEPYVDEGESPNVEYKDQQQKMVDSDTDQKIKILVPVRRERPSRIQRKVYANRYIADVDHMPDNPNANQQMHNTSLLQQNGRFNTSQEYVGPNEFTVASAAANGDKIDDDDRMNGQVKHHFSDEYSHSTQAQDGDEGGYQNQYQLNTSGQYTDDECSAFAKTVEVFLRDMPKRKRVLAKRELQNVIYKYELQEAEESY